MLKMGISGAGYAGHYYVKALTELGYPVTGITNRTRERGAALAEKAGANFYDSVEEMVRHSGVDIIFIATSTDRHVSDIEAAASAGAKNIFCEKPVGVSLQETGRIREICEAHSINVGVGYKMRYEGIFKTAHDLLAEGRIGRLAGMTLNFYQTIPHSPWYLNSGYIRETMVHTLDLANWLADAQPESVMCSTENFAGGSMEDRASLIVRYQDGVTASLGGGWIQEYPYIAGRKNICFEIVGTGGYICGVRPGHLLICDGDGLRNVDFEPTDSVKCEIVDFVQKLENAQPAAITLDDAERVQRILTAAAASEKSGKKETV